MESCYRNPARNRSRINDQDEDVQQSEDSGTVSDNFAYDTLRADREHETLNDVPPLGISLDTDQIKYLQQQKSHRRREYGQTIAEMAGPNNTGTDRVATPDKTRTDQVMSEPARRNGATKHQL